MPALFDREPTSSSRRRNNTEARGPSKHWDAGLQQFVRSAAPAPTKNIDGVGSTVPRLGARALERSPGPQSYNLQAGPESAGYAGSAAFKATADRSLVNKSQAAVPGIGSYDAAAGSRLGDSVLNAGPSAEMRSTSKRFQESAQQKLTASLPSGYAGTSSFEYGSISFSASKAMQKPSSAFASSTIRDSYVPLPKGEAARILRKAEEEQERQLAWEEELQRQREADPEWQAMEAARIAAEEAERAAIEQAARDAAERVQAKEREEHRQRWLAARAAEEWAWRQAEEEAEAVEAAQGTAKTRLRQKAEEERHNRREKQKLGALWAWTEAEEEEGEEAEWDDDGEDAAQSRWRIEEERESRIAARAAELVRQREEEMRREASEKAEAAAMIAGERAAERVRQVQMEEREAAREAWEAREAAEAARDTDAEALKIEEAAMTAAQRVEAQQEREARAAERAIERARFEAEQSRLLAEEERAVRRAYEEARAAEKERLDAEEKVRREEEKARQELAVQDWSWQEAMELAWDRHEKAVASEALMMERKKIGAVASRQKIAEEKSLARSQMSRMNNVSGFGTQSQSAWAQSTASRFDKTTEEAIKYVNPELRAKQRTHERMLKRSTRRAERLNEAAVVGQKFARRWLGRRELKRRRWHNELEVAAPPLQALVRGWKVRSRLKWCANVATLLQRWVRGMLGRRLARWQKERVPTIQAAARGLAARVAYRRVIGAATAIAAGTKGMFARGVARRLLNDPVKIKRWERFVAIRSLVDELDKRLGELAASRAAESSQLKLALQHEQDKLGAAYRDAPAVGVMLKQEKLAAQDSEEIAVGRSRSVNLIKLLAQVPFARAADASQAVAAEVEWLHELVEQQSRRDELYRPASHRPKELMNLFNSPPGGVRHLTRDEQIESYRSVSPSHSARQQLSYRDEPEPEPLTEEEIAVERARRAAAKRAAANSQHLGGAPKAAWNETAPAPKKWMGKGPPPPGWNKVRNMPPPPPGFKPGTASAAAAAAAALAKGAGRPASAPKERGGRSPSPRPGSASPAAQRKGASRSPSPVVPSLKTAGGAFGFTASPSASVRSTGGKSSAKGSPQSAMSSGRSSITVSSVASSRASSAAPTGGVSMRSNASSSADSSARLRKAVAKRAAPRTQLDFEQQRLERMAKAAMAREQETLEKAKRQAQRSKRVAGFIIDPKKLEEQKRQREREAIVKLKDEKAKEHAARAIAEAEREAEKEAHQAKAAKAGELALERLRVRKAEERKKREAQAEAEQMQKEMEEEAEEMAKQARAEQRRLRSQTSFFSRPQDGAAAGAAGMGSSMLSSVAG